MEVVQLYFFLRVKNDLLFGSSFFSEPGGRVLLLSASASCGAAWVLMPLTHRFIWSSSAAWNR